MTLKFEAPTHEMHYGHTSMPLVSSDVSKEELHELNAAIKRRPITHPLHKETTDGDVTVLVHEHVVVLHSAAGFYFRRLEGSLMDTLRAEINDNQRTYLCTTFEVDQNDPSVVQKLLERFVENHGRKLANQIDHHVFPWNGKTLMLVKLPSSVVRHMLAHTGGFLRTVCKGPKAQLLKLPILRKFGNIPTDAGDSDIVESAFATEYKAQHYTVAQHMHYNLLREVIAHPSCGITLSPFALWDA